MISARKNAKENLGAYPAKEKEFCGKLFHMEHSNYPCSLSRTSNTPRYKSINRQMYHLLTAVLSYSAAPVN